MSKFKLQSVPDYPGYIRAPEWCPYKTSAWSYPEYDKTLGAVVRRKEVDDVVHASLCPLCRQCDFIVENTVAPSSISGDERSMFVNYLTQVDTRAATTMSAQHAFLGRKQKLPLAILLSPILFDTMLDHVFAEDAPRRKKVYSCFLYSEEPICHIMGLPVYLSRKLTKSYLQVVGEQAWK